ncbi:MAG: amylo-alpha-1,6-glucosidase, partial [Thermoleophilia bacterium]|nr:amylo-alpha-1,6-glucosidase [Thermoleophilia bacterium]
MSDAADPPAILVGDTSAITLIDGLTFAISDALGDIEGGSSGLIADDTRHLSRLRLSVDDAPVRALGAAQLSPSTARFRGFAEPEAGRADPSLEVERRRRVGADGLEDELVLRWWAPAPRRVSVGLDLDADFSDIFAIRGMDTGSAAHADSVRAETTADGIRFHDHETGLETNVRFDPVPDALVGGGARWAPELRRGEPWRMTTTVEVGTTGQRRPRAPAGGSRPAVGVVTDPPDLGRGCRRALGDLRALSMPDRLAPGRRLVAAGIPWFVALFGRDSLIAGHQARAFLPGQVMDTLAALADRQGRVSDPGNEEEPGKILHEVRLTPRAWLGEGTVSGARPYYGTIDATPLFLILYGTALRWGASRAQLEALLPAARAAAGWIRGPGDPDGDGLLEYAPMGPRSLSNQAWKDSEDAVQFADGRLAEGPIAMVEVQGYAYRARCELAAVLRHLGHGREAGVLEDEA